MANSVHTLWNLLSAGKVGKLTSLFSVILIVFLGQNNLRGEHDSTQITNLKATFIVHTLKYVRWHDEDFPHLNLIWKCWLSER